MTWFWNIKIPLLKRGSIHLIGSNFEMKWFLGLTKARPTWWVLFKNSPIKTGLDPLDRFYFWNEMILWLDKSSTDLMSSTLKIPRSEQGSTHLISSTYTLKWDRDDLWVTKMRNSCTFDYLELLLNLKKMNFLEFECEVFILIWSWSWTSVVTHTFHKISSFFPCCSGLSLTKNIKFPWQTNV